MVSKLRRQRDYLKMRSRNYEDHDIETYTISTPIGDMFIKSCSYGLHSVSDNNAAEENFKPVQRGKVKLLTSSGNVVHSHVEDCIKWLSMYFEKPCAVKNQIKPNICVAQANGTFQEKVWLTLAERVQPGETISYARLAEIVGSPGASRAVGTAMASNPIQIIVPCHRVIRSDGSVGLYSKGCKNFVKDWLLQHEGVKIVGDRKILE